MKAISAKKNRELLPVLWALGEGLAGPVDFRRFADKLTNAICEKSKLSPANEDIPKLSPRQRAILSYLCRGMARGEIAAVTGLAPETVKAHLKVLYKKLGVHGAMDAIAKANALDLLENDI